MKKVIFQTYKGHDLIKEVAEYEDETKDEDIKSDFIEWLCEQHYACWYIEGEE